MPLYGRMSPKQSTTLRPSRSPAAGIERQRPPAGAARCSKTPCGITCTSLRREPELADEPLPARARSGRRRRRPRRAAASRAAPAAATASRGSTSCAVSTRGRGNARSRRRSSGGSGSHWKCTTSARSRRARRARRSMSNGAGAAWPRALPTPQAVEALGAAVALAAAGPGRGEAARDELDVGPRARERRAERVVVGRRVGGRVDDA